MSSVPSSVSPIDSVTDAAISVSDLTVAYDRTPVLWDLHLEIPPATLTGIIGPNGAGKSTFLKAIMNIGPSSSGRILIYGEPYTLQRALTAYVPQRNSVDWDFPVNALEVVTMGLYRQIGWFRRVSAAHRRRSMEALHSVGMEGYAHRHISKLSGGQQQRVFLARALVQEAQIFLMDEPFAGVDAKTEKSIVTLLQELRARQKTVIVVHHDLRTVPQYFDNLIMLNRVLIAAGPTEETFTKENLYRCYGDKMGVVDL